MTMLCNRQRQLLNVCAMRIGTLCDDEQTRPKKHRKPQMMTANIKLLLYFSIFIFRLFSLLRFSLLIFNHQMLRKHHSKRINGLIFQIKVIIKREHLLSHTLAYVCYPNWSALLIACQPHIKTNDLVQRKYAMNLHICTYTFCKRFFFLHG